MRKNRLLSRMANALPLLLALLLVNALNFKTYSQTVTNNILGKVSDSKTGEAVVGASVKVKGGKAGTATDGNGAFKIDAPSSATLIITASGYAEIQIAAKGNLSNIKLVQTTKDLDDVVVVGYGTKKKETLTGAITTVGEEVFKDRPVPNALAALQGQIPGLTITRTSSRPGNEGLGIVLRGATSVVATDPLVIIDGIPAIGTYELSQINPNDIESVTALKDGSAAIYGARSQGGVILITTKRGKSGKMQVNFRSNVSTNTIGIRVPWANMPQWATLYLQTSTSDKRDANGNPVEFFPQWTKDNLIKMAADSSFDYTDPSGVVHHYADNNWQDALYGSAWSTQQNLSIRGANDKTAYALSVGYSNDKSILKTAYDGEKKYNLRLNYDYNVSTKVKLETGISYDTRIINTPRNGIGNGYFDAPIFPVYNKLGQYYDDYGYRNPVAFTQSGGTTNASVSFLRLNSKLSAEIFNGFKFTGQASIVKRDGWLKSYNQSFNFYNWLGTLVTSPRFAPPNDPFVTEVIDNTVYQTYLAQLDYTKTIAKDHHISAMVGATDEYSINKAITASRSQLQFTGLYDLNTAISPATSSYLAANSGGSSQYGFYSFIGRVGYDYKSKYILEGLGRRDGSSKFDVGHKWSNFYNVSAAWIVSKEAFFKNVKFINFLKVRAGHGETGGQANVGNFDYVSGIGFGAALFGSTPALQNTASLSGITTNDKTWERVVKENVGVDFAFLDNRLSGNFDVFRNKNIGMLIRLVYPTVLGGSSPLTNGGSLESKGFEFALNWKEKAGSVFYNVGVTLSNAKNTVLSYAGANTWAAGKYTTPREGYPLNSLYVYKTNGYFKTQAEADTYFKTYGASGNAAGYNGTTNTFHPGDLKVVDLDGDGKITATGTGVKGSGDAYFYGDADPHYTFGVNLGLNWKGFDFSAFIQGVAKWNILRGGNARAPFFRNYANINTTFLGKTWTPDNVNAEYPRVSFDGGINNWNWTSNDVNIQHLRYARLKSLIIGYSLPKGLISKVKTQNMRFFFAGNDIFEITSVKDGFDPERGESADNSYPFLRTWAFGLDLTF